MAEIFLSILFFGLLIAAMAVGVLMGGKPISGSCGGVGAALGEEDYICDICGGDPDKCEEQDVLVINAYNVMDAEKESFKA